MTPVDSAPDDQMAPLRRSASILFTVAPGDMRWGATWAYLCGAFAAASWPASAAVLARLLVGWFVAVPLAGVFWVPLSSQAARQVRPAGAAGRAERNARGPWGVVAFLRASWRSVVPGDESRGRLLTLILLLSLALLLGPGVLAVLLAVLVWVAAEREVRRDAAGPGSFTRSVLEIFVPGLIGWLALGGPQPVPGPQMVAGGLAATIGTWLRLNWPVIVVLLAFTLVHYGTTAEASRRELGRRRLEIGAGYVAAVGALAVSAHPLGAGAVAMLYVLQWPFQARLQMGQVRWHMLATQWMAMVAMFIGVVAAGSGPGPG